MESDKLCQETINKIKEKHLKPKPRWEFILRNYVFWFIFAISLIIGSLAMSVIIHMIKYGDWDLHDRLSGGLINFIIITMPYIWLVIFGLLIFTSYYYLHNTKSGYRYGLAAVITISLFISFVFGSTAFWAGFDEVIINNVYEKVPLYENLTFNRAKMWVQPEKGLLAGTIVEMSDEENFGLHDFTSRTWQINSDRANLKDRAKILIGENIKLIGELVDEDEFRAIEIRPWGSMCTCSHCALRASISPACER